MLNSDLLWDSKSFEDQREAIRARVARRLGEQRTSAMYQRVILKEGEAQTVVRCITLEQIQLAIKNSDYLSSFDKKNKLTKNGLFDNGHINDTYERLLHFLEDMINYIADKAKDEWAKGDEGMLSINRSLYGYIRLLNDILVMSCKGDKPDVDPLNDTLEDVENVVKLYLDPLIEYFNQLTPIVRADLKQYAGTSGYKKFWRTFQKIVRDRIPEFNPPGLDEYLEDESKQYNDTTRLYLVEIEKVIKKQVSEKLKEIHGENWLMLGIPKKIYGKAKSSADKRNYDIIKNNENVDQVTAWDYITLENVQKIITQQNWSDTFEKMLGMPGIKGDKTARTRWIIDMQKLKSKLNGPRGVLYSVKKAEYADVEKVYGWLCKKEAYE